MFWDTLTYFPPYSEGGRFVDSARRQPGELSDGGHVDSAFCCARWQLPP